MLYHLQISKQKIFPVHKQVFANGTDVFDTFVKRTNFVFSLSSVPIYIDRDLCVS